MTALPFLQSPLLNHLGGINHGFFTRRGGVSGGEFESLNCGQYSGDNPQHVRENRARVAAALDCNSVVSLRQVHGDHVHVIEQNRQHSATLQGDGLVTREKGVALGILGADCAPVLFVDAENSVIGAAHAGWKGAVCGITDQVISVMCGLGADISQMAAVIGPAIQACSYEVGVEFQEQVSARSEIECADCFSATGVAHKRMFDLPLYIEKKLRNAGIPQIHRMLEDTCSNERQFFSYRRACQKGEKHYGRQTGAICLKR